MAPGSTRGLRGGRAQIHRVADVDEPIPASTYRVPLLALIFAVVVGPFNWFAHLSLVSAFASWQCARGTTWPVNVLTLVLGLTGVASMAVAWWIHVKARRVPGSARASAVAFIAFVGLLWGGISLVATIAEGIPNLAGVASCPR
ncbi:MAG TPA: hypothetical protein VFN21_00025 [Acidimicrobiales bacterium]|nr:hypothetical protein [Acidimicrobiales bacterium]